MSSNKFTKLHQWRKGEKGRHEVEWGEEEEESNKHCRKANKDKWLRCIEVEMMRSVLFYLII